MSDWKELELGNIPSDFFVNERYEIDIKQGSGWEEATAQENKVFRATAICDLKKKKKYNIDDDEFFIEYRYRLKPLKPMQVTAEIFSDMSGKSPRRWSMNIFDNKKYFDGREVIIID